MPDDRGFPWCVRCQHPQADHDLAGRCYGTTMVFGTWNFSRVPRGTACTCGAEPDARSSRYWPGRNDSNDDEEEDDRAMVTKNASSKGKTTNGTSRSNRTPPGSEGGKASPGPVRVPPKGAGNGGTSRQTAMSPSGAGSRLDLKAQKDASLRDREATAQRNRNALGNKQARSGTPSPAPKRAAGATRAAEQTVATVAGPAVRGRPNGTVLGRGVASSNANSAGKPAKSAPAKRTTKNAKGR
jgi:hypothetical protein